MRLIIKLYMHLVLFLEPFFLPYYGITWDIEYTTGMDIQYIIRKYIKKTQTKSHNIVTSFLLFHS